MPKKHKVHEMKISYIVAPLLILMGLCFACASPHKANDTMNDLTVTAVVSKQELTLGDQLTITADIKNNSTSSFHILRRPRPYATDQILLFKNGTQALETYTLVRFEITPYSKDDFIELRPGSKTSISYTAELREEAIRDVRQAGRPMIKGVFLRFYTAAILIPEKATYKLMFEYKVDKSIKPESQEIGIRDLWTGKVTSKPVQLVIK
jgi:hypothetical protein